METTVDTPVAAINWQSVADEIHCPLCDYNLRGLNEPRCPECGSRYAWSDLFDAARRLHPFLYEHHPERSFPAFWKTLAAGLRPRRFWQGLHPVQPCYRGRLFRYACLTMGVQLLVMVVSHLTWAYEGLVATANGWGAPPAGVPGPSISAVLAQSMTRLDARTLLVGCWPPLMLLLWSAVSCLTLFIFQTSMRRARLRSVHVFRAVVYSFDLLLWFAVLLLSVDSARMIFAVESATVPHVEVLFGLIRCCVVVACISLAAYRLMMAYRHYLQFDRPYATILASQIICGLAVLNGLLMVRIW